MSSVPNSGVDDDWREFTSRCAMTGQCPIPASAGTASAYLAGLGQARRQDDDDEPGGDRRSRLCIGSMGLRTRETRSPPPPPRSGTASAASTPDTAYRWSGQARPLYTRAARTSSTLPGACPRHGGARAKNCPWPPHGGRLSPALPRRGEGGVVALEEFSLRAQSVQQVQFHIGPTSHEVDRRSQGGVPDICEIECPAE